ncbi:MAG: choice-of-anchor D domain-containing protein [Prevotellaceae bacterium]|jgi:hypothetical protein|nr:choice-of-anchor D domain-containing protein [Prevotellaceae bacterium]
MKATKKRMLWAAFALGVSTTGAFAQQQNRDEVPKGQFLNVQTRARSYVKVSDVYSADALKLSTEWTSNGFSLQTADGSAVFTTGQYAPNAQLSAVSAAIQLPEVAAAGKGRLVLQVDEIFKTETKYDRMYVKVSADGGQSWQLVSKASGSSGWRSHSINITSFAGKSVIISLSLSADGSIESDGWSIAGVSIYTANLAKPQAQGSRMMRSLNTNQIASLEIINVHTEDYPEAVFVDFLAKDNNGNVVPDLDRNDFKIVNDNVEDGTSCKELYHANHALRPAVDIVFIMDNSGSMSDDQQNVADNLELMIDNLYLSGYDTRLGLVRFGQGANGDAPGATSGSPIVEPNPSLTTSAFFYDANDFINFWYAKNVDDGGYEPGYWAMAAAANSPLIQFRDYAEKIFLIITDEDISSWGGENVSQYSMSDAISALNAKGIRLFAITENTSAFRADYKPVCDSTKGDFYPNIKSSFSGIFADLAGSISSKYTLRFCPPPGTVQDTIDPNYCIPLTLETTETPAISVSTCYTPKPLPRIVRDVRTQALDGVTQSEDQFIFFAVEVLDADPDSIQGVRVYWRVINDTSDLKSVSFAPYSMLRSGPTTFYYNIPANKVKRYSIEYYFVAQFTNKTEVNSPTETQEYFAWTIPIAPNYAPDISNLNPPTQSYPCQDITIKAGITDDTDTLKKVLLFYKTNQAPSIWVQVPMIAPDTANPNVFAATIPAAAMQTTGVSYYLYAEDNFGAQGWDGTPEEPHVIAPRQDPMPSQGEKMTITARNTNNIQTACSPLGGSDELKAYFTNSCGQLQVGGAATITPGTNRATIVVSANTGQGYKNGFDLGEEIYFRLVRDGLEYDLALAAPVYFAYGIISLPAAAGIGNPQIEVRGGGLEIAPNDMTPDVSDNTDFGEQISGTSTPHAFTISNTGCADLVVSSIAVNDTTNFLAPNLQQPAYIYPGDSYSFSVAYRAKATATAILSIINNSLNPFSFAVKGAKSAVSNNDCGISVYPNPMTSSDYGGFVAFDVLVTSEVVVYVVDMGTGVLKQLVLDLTTLPAGRYTHYISKPLLGGAGTYLVVVSINGSPCTGTLAVQ